MGPRRTGNVKEGRNYISVSTWLNPIVIMPKKAELGEQLQKCLCVDYRVLNSLLPPLVKACSKAQGVLSLCLY